MTDTAQKPRDPAKQVALVKSVLNAMAAEGYMYQRDLVTLEGDIVDIMPHYGMSLISQIMDLCTDLETADPQAVQYVDELGNPSTDGQAMGIPPQIANIIFDLIWLCKRLGLDVGTLMIDWLRQARKMSQMIQQETAGAASSMREEDDEEEAPAVDSSLTP